MCSRGHLHDHAKGAASSSSEGKEDVLVLAAICGDVGTVGEDDFELLHIIRTQSEDGGQQAVAACGDPAASRSDSCPITTHHRHLVRLGELPSNCWPAPKVITLPAAAEQPSGMKFSVKVMGGW